MAARTTNGCERAAGCTGRPLLFALSRGFLRRPVSPPHLFDVVEGPGLRAEDMDDDIARIDQDPIAERHSFDSCIANAALLQLIDEAVRDSANMTLRAPRGDDHEIRKRRLTGQRDTDDLVCLGVLQRIDDQVGEGGGSRSGALFCAARSESGGLLIQRVKPQREDPSFE